MKVIQIVKDGEVIASFEENNGEIKGICKDGYKIIVDGEELETA